VATERPQTWHYGLVAEYWAAHNDGFRPHELPYFRRFLENGGVPALEVACGTGRLLLPYLRAGLDIDGCDISPDMVELCRKKAAREGSAPMLWAQPMHELEPPRSYRTIYVCGAFGLGSTREQDREALRRFHEHLERGGTLLLDIEVPWADEKQWKLWTSQGRQAMPAPPKERGEPPTSPGVEYVLRSRCLELDPLEQRVAYEMHVEKWRNGRLEAEEDRRLDINLYFPNELLLLLEQAGFTDVVVHGDHIEAPPTPDDEFVFFVARKLH
jgi:SAM-dependent methyltransferase